MIIKDIAFFSDCGVRDVNQDAIYASANKSRGVFVVADGMGGHFGGETASSAIVNGIRNWWDSNDFTDAEAGIDGVLEQCASLLHNINREVFSYFSERGQMGGSTVAVLILWDHRYGILSVGDSRIYRVRERALEQITTDDVWENLPEVKYGMENERVVGDSRFGKLTEALGSEERLKVNRCGGMLSARESFLLCSDGVYKCCPQEALEKIMCRGWGLRSASRRKQMIRKCAIKNGAEDNYSAIICSVRL